MLNFSGSHKNVYNKLKMRTIIYMHRLGLEEKRNFSICCRWGKINTYVTTKDLNPRELMNHISTAR